MKKQKSWILLVELLSLVLALRLVEGASTLIDFGSKTEWKYLDDGSNPGQAWREPSFDDSKWKSGPAPLGYNEFELTTRLSFGNDPNARFITSYFRHGFQVADPGDAKKLVLLLRCDDGAVVYMNGKELARSNMESGEVTFLTRARRDIEGEEEKTYQRYLSPASFLAPGNNVVAVEVHQSKPTSDDLFFDLVLKTYREGEEPHPAKVNREAKEVVLTYRTKHYIAPEMKIPDGYVDGGRAMKVAADGSIDSYREVLLVDRSRDAALRKHLEFAKSRELLALDPLERARRLAKYINECLLKREDPVRAQLFMEVFQGEYAGREVFLGDVDTGVCRHQALLFKLMADEAGLKAALVRGIYRFGSSIGGHAWNELFLEDGKRLIVDVINPRPDLRFPEVSERVARRYFGVTNQPLYVEEQKSRGEKEKAPRVDKEELRKLARLPGIQLSLSMRVTEEGLECFQPKAGSSEGGREVLRRGEKAEKALREAVALKPKEWKAWADLGELLTIKAFEALLTDNARKSQDSGQHPDLEELFRSVLEKKPAPELAAPSRKIIDEALQSYERAAEVVSEDASAYSWRGMYLAVIRPYLQSTLRSLSGENANPYSAVFPPECLPDLKRAALLRPDFVHAADLSSIAEFLSLRLHPTKLSGQANKEESNGSGALALGPEVDRASDMLMALMVRAGRFEDLVAVCNEHLKRKDSVRTRLILAKAYESLDRFEELRKQVDAALALQPNDSLANLAGAAVALKGGEKSQAVARAGEHLRKAYAGLEKPPTRDQGIACSIFVGLFLALNDRCEEAIEILEGALAQDGDNEGARTILMAIDR